MNLSSQTHQPTWTYNTLTKSREIRSSLIDTAKVPTAQHIPQTRPSRSHTFDTNLLPRLPLTPKRQIDNRLLSQLRDRLPNQVPGRPPIQSGNSTQPHPTITSKEIVEKSSEVLGRMNPLLQVSIAVDTGTRVGRMSNRRIRNRKSSGGVGKLGNQNRVGTSSGEHRSTSSPA